MIRVRCDCGAAAVELAENQSNRPFGCGCGRVLTCVSAETLPDGAGSIDFDARLQIQGGPSRVGESIFLGGCFDIGIGKSPDNAIVLPGKMVSRAHCKLCRIDIGPSRWRIEDNHSTNGLFVNGERVTSQELQPGDIVRVGEYELAYSLVEEPALAAVAAEAYAPSQGGGTATMLAPAAAATATSDGRVCPSCERPVARKAKICVQCGIKVDSGRPVLTSQGLDENMVYGNSETIIRVLSWLIWVTPMPMPIASEAYGTRKPYTIWSIAAVTILASLIFFFAIQNESASALGLMLWPPGQSAAQRMDVEIRSLERQMRQQGQPVVRTQEDREVEAEVREMLEEMVAAREELRHAQFAWWQLFTHALLHDPDGIIGLILHLGGNMLFLLVFGSRVNALIGSAATAMVYPILAAAAAGAYLMFLPAEDFAPMLGASGAVFGLAGMYLVIFPVHRVYCAMWLRLWFRFQTYFALKIFAIRGFWVLLIYFAYDAAMIALGVSSGTAHWAHVGGFIAGMLLGLVILFSRQFNCRNGDLLSVVLGKYAWPLIGKPSRWVEA